MDLEAELGESFDWKGRHPSKRGGHDQNQARQAAEAAARERGRLKAKAEVQSETLGTLAAELASAQALLTGKAAPKDRAELAAGQVERLTGVERGLTAALFRGEVDAATHATGCRSLEAMRKQLWLFAERLDAQQWAARQAVPAIININSPIDGMSPADVAELVAEVKRIRQQRQALPGVARVVPDDAE